MEWGKYKKLLKACGLYSFEDIKLFNEYYSVKDHADQIKKLKEHKKKIKKGI